MIRMVFRHALTPRARDGTMRRVGAPTGATSRAPHVNDATASSMSSWMSNSLLSFVITKTS